MPGYRSLQGPGLLQRFCPSERGHGGREGPSEGCRGGRAERHVSKPALAPPDRDPGVLAPPPPTQPLAPFSLGSQESGPSGTNPGAWPLRGLWSLGPQSSSPLGYRSPEPFPQDSGHQSPSARFLLGVRAPSRSTADPAPPTRTLLPKLIPSGAGREWLERRRATIRPWGSFVDQRRFSRPRNLGELCQRLVRNVEFYQSNYVFVFLGLILYCV